MLTYTDDKVKELARGEWFWGGVNDSQFEVAARAVDLLADDPMVLSHCFEIWHYYAHPVAPGYAYAEKRAQIRPLIDKGLTAGERILDANPALDTADLRVLAFFVHHIRALDELVDEPDEAALADANRRVDAMFDLINQPPLSNEERRYDDAFRCAVLARLRSWELLRAGPPYPAELIERLRGYVDNEGGCLGWPMVPLARDPKLLAYAEQVLAARTAAGEHASTSPFSVLYDDYGAITTDDLAGRLVLALWFCGIDQATFLERAAEAIARPTLLQRLLSLGFDCNAYADSGETLLHAAVAADSADAVRVLVAAGADPDRKARKGKKQSARKLALARKRKAVIAALEGATATPAVDDNAAGKLAASLLAAATRVKEKDTQFIASCFNVQNLDVAKIVERALARNPDSPAAILDDARDVFVVDRFVLARVLVEAGHRADHKLRGTTVLSGDLTVAGDLSVDGALIDQVGTASVVVTGNLSVHALVTEAECIVGRDLRARDFVWGDGSDGTLAVAGGVTTPVLVMTDHTYEPAGKETIKRTLHDPDDDELAAVFAPAVLADGSVDRDLVIGALRGKRDVVKTAKAKAKAKTKTKAEARAKTKAKAKTKTKARAKKPAKKTRQVAKKRSSKKR